MTEEDYYTQRMLYGTSDAPVDVIDKAIKALDAEWQANTTDSERAKALSNALVERSEPDGTE